MTGRSPVRSCEDVDETVLSYAEVKALATGNPYIKEKMTLDVEVTKLKMMKANFSSQKYRMEDNIALKYPEKIAALEGKIQRYSADIQAYMQNRPADRETFYMKVGSMDYYSRKEAGAALIEMCRQISCDETVIGEYQGFQMSAVQTFFCTKCQIHIKGRICHESEASSDPFGIIQRLDNVLEAMPDKLQELQQELDNVCHQLETAKQEVLKPFEKEQELLEKSARLAELNALLNMDECAESVETGQPGDAKGQAGRQAEPGTGENERQNPDGEGSGENTVEKNQGQTYHADTEKMPGCMEVRTSVRKRLASIRERRAAEQTQGKAQKQEVKHDRAESL